MRILVLSGSTRSDSLNTRLAHAVAEALPEAEVSVEAGLARLPHYDADVEAQGAPEVVQELREAVAASDLLLVATPEYNGTTPGVLVNALDWLSRPYAQSVLIGRPAAVLTASPGARGGVRARSHAAQLLATIGAEVAGEGLALAHAGDRLAPAARATLLEEIRTALAPALDLAGREAREGGRAA
ncbi:NAD(P)H-dependent oxidoreductase [Kineococcus sp. NUM-3379]